MSPAAKWTRIAAVACFCLTAAGLALAIPLYNARQDSREASCRIDVSMLGGALHTYAMAHDGLLPDLSHTPGQLVMEPTGFYPEYLNNTCWLQCEWGDMRRRPEHHKNEDLGLSAFTSDSFCYFPWALSSEEEGLAFVEAYKSGDLSTVRGDLTVDLNGAAHSLPRIRISRDFQDKAIEGQSTPTVPIALEWPGKFHRRGSVLFSDGETVSMALGEGFPMTENFIAALQTIVQNPEE